MKNSTRQILKSAWKLARPFWFGSEGRLGLGLLAVVIALNLGLVAIAILLTYWQHAFFNALEVKDWEAFLNLLFSWHSSPETGLMFGFGPILAVSVAFTVYALYLQQALQIRWRRWMTTQLIDGWLGGRSYYLLNLGVGRADNPDQRIAEDIALFVDDTLTLGLGLLKAVVSLFSFIVLLWSLSESVTVFGVTIPGYLVWLALIYAGVGTVATHLFGRSLIRLNFERQRREADFRFGLVRVRENTEGIATHNGEHNEAAELERLLASLVENWYRIMTVTKRMTFFTSSYSQAALVFPLAISAPAYFAGRIPLGGMFQTANAFVQVQTALSWIVENYSKIAEWAAAVIRLDGFISAVEETKRHAGGPAFVHDAGMSFSVSDLQVELPDGRPLVERASLDIAPGTNVVVIGESGAGKSTLLRVLAGIWPFGHGTVRIPTSRLMFLPQKPYMPIGTLRRVLSYPEGEMHYSDAEIRAVLDDVGLGRLGAELDNQEKWGERLSGGELQRVAFARALLYRPDWLLLDEATANLDEGWQTQFHRLIEPRLPDTTLISVSHRPHPAEVRDRVLVVREGAIVEA